MKKISFFIQLVIFAVASIMATSVYAEDNKKVTHVVMVWLKEPGNAQHRKQFVKASEQLNDLPGIVSRHVGVVQASDRAIVDDTFDVAVTVTMKNKAALKAYLNHPKHKKVLHDRIKPLINRVVAYDFVSQ